MPRGITRHSRHRFCDGYADDAGRTYLGPREPYGYRALSDNRHHVVATGDTLWGLAARYFAGLPRPSGFWWVIADFQPDPIHDPTIPLEVGRVLVVPSTRTLDEQILNERRRREVEG